MIEKKTHAKLTGLDTEKNEKEYDKILMLLEDQDEDKKSFGRAAANETRPASSMG